MKSNFFDIYRSLERWVGKFTALVLALLLVFLPTFFITPQKVYAATSPTLGDVDSFSILGYLGITDAAPASTTITGDIGVRPTTGASITSACSSMSDGTIYTVDAAGPICREVNPALLLSAMNANTAAYGNLVLGDNLPAGCTTIDNELGGQTLVPGLYCTDGNMTLNGTLTLSGTTGVWIFQSPSSLTTVSADAKVVGGDPCNVWWHLPDETTGAVIGSGSTMIGNILALGAIDFGEGATLNGRALSQTGNVTLIGNTITKAVCTGSSAPTSTLASSLSSGSGGGSATAPAAEVCPPLNYVAPIILESSRVDPDSVFVSWGPYSGTDTFIVEYGFENGNWLYSTNVTGFSTTINDLPSNQPIWIRVAGTDNCSVGVHGEAKLVGGPKLPNTGIASHQGYTFWYIVAGIFVFSPFILKAIRIRYKK